MNHARLNSRAALLLALLTLAGASQTARAQFTTDETPAPAAGTAPAPAVQPERPFDAASKLYEQGKQAEALVTLQRLAEEGDARAQFLVGLDLLEGVHIKRDNAQGFAYLLLASEDTVWGDLVAPRAREARALVEPQLSGAELIRADALVGAYRARPKTR